jgi:sugar O-acyltransferase (sialic acid O-acetyltransferase NeuD family)
MDRKYVVFGCGSQARYVIDNMESREGLVDAMVDLEEGAMVGKFVNGVPVRWKLSDALSELDPDVCTVIIAHGDNALKLRLAGELSQKGFAFATAIHVRASVSPSASIAQGCIVNSGAVIMPNTVIEPHATIHSGSVIEHDCVIGTCANIAPGVSLAGRVRVGKCSYLYTGCCIIPKVTIGENAVIGAGAVVLKDVPDNAKVVGNPGIRIE